jgi:hypothetical protein
MGTGTASPRTNTCGVRTRSSIRGVFVSIEMALGCPLERSTTGEQVQCLLKREDETRRRRRAFSWRKDDGQIETILVFRPLRSWEARAGGRRFSHKRPYAN